MLYVHVNLPSGVLKYSECSKTVSNSSTDKYPEQFISHWMNIALSLRALFINMAAICIYMNNTRIIIIKLSMHNH